jgi:RNA polymerase sigma-70 factor (ECF subfamily)
MGTRNQDNPASTEEQILVKQCRQGNEAALEVIYRRYRQDLFILALSLLKDAGRAEDAIQDVFLRFVQNLSRFRLTGSLRGYLLVCVANRARNDFRDRERHQRAASRRDRADDIEEPVQRVAGNEQMDRLTQAMQGLPYEQREVVLLHTHGQMAFSAVAENLSISVNTAKSRYRYGLQNLRRTFTDEADL